jgi:hypothetical protein
MFLSQSLLIYDYESFFKELVPIIAAKESILQQYILTFTLSSSLPPIIYIRDAFEIM